MKMSFLFLLCHSTRSGYIPQEGYCSSRLNKKPAKKPGSQNFIIGFPWLLYSLMILLVKSWKSTSWRDPINPAANKLYKSAGWKMEKFKPAHFHLIFVGTNALPAIFQRQNTPSERFGLFFFSSLFREWHYALCTVRCSNSCPQYQISNLIVDIFVASSVVASKCFKKTCKFLLCSLPLVWRLFNPLLQTGKWGMEVLGCLGPDF